MAILSKVKSKVKSVASSVASGVKSVASKVVGGIKTAVKSVGGISRQGASFGALPSAPKTATSSDTRGKINSIASQYTAGYTPAPRTVTSGAKSSGVSGSWGAPLRTSSNYSSPSYDTSNLGLSSSDLAYYSQPRTVAGGISTGGFSETSNGTGTRMVLPSAPTGADYSGDVIMNNASLGASPETGLFVPPPVEAPQEKTELQNFNDYVRGLNESQNKYDQELQDAQDQAYKDSGVEAARVQRQNTQNQINTITAKMNADLLGLRQTAGKEGVVEAVYGGQKAQVTYEASIQLLPLQAQLAADQGNLEIAEEKLNDLYSLYTKQIDRRAEHRESILKATWDFFNEGEKRKLQSQENERKFKEDLLKKEIDNTQAQAMQALQDGNMPLYRALVKLQPPINISSPTYEKDRENFLNDRAKITEKFGAGFMSIDDRYKQAMIDKTYADMNTKGSGKPATGAEKQVLAFYNRAQQAVDDIAKVEDNIINLGLAGQFRLKYANNWLQSAEGKLYNQAQRAFTEARLRKESGAAIPPAEYEQDRLTYFAQPGDDKTTAAQKKAARQVVLNGLKYSSGNAYQEYYGVPPEFEDVSQIPKADVASLAKQKGFDYDAAKKAGYTDEEIENFLK